MKKFATLLGILVFALSLYGQQRILVRASQAQLEAAGVTKSESVIPNWRMFTAVDTTVMKELRAKGLYAEVDYEAQLYDNGNSAASSQNPLQWWITASNRMWNGDFRDAWVITKGDVRVKVGILDTGSPRNHGVWTHPGLDSSRFIVGPSFMDQGTTVDSDLVNTDYAGHSTHIAGIIGGKENDSVGISGVDNRCRIEFYKCFSMFGVGYYSAIANAIYRAAEDSCKILNMSFGGIFYSRLLEDAMKYATNRGVLCVVAAGNFGDETQSFPAFFGKFSTDPTYTGGLPGIISVGSINPNGRVSWFSNYGYFVDVYAPGGAGNLPADAEDILSTWPLYLAQDTTAKLPRGYHYLAGTSMAAPMIVGTASLMLAVNPKLTPAQLQKMICSSADTLMTVNGPVLVLNPGQAVRNARDSGGVISAVQDKKSAVPEEFGLSQNYPNPFNPMTVIRYQVSGYSHVTLDIYNVLGQKVATLVNEEKPAGSYSVTFNASDLPSGMYIYKLQAGSFVETKKMILLK